MSFNPSLNNQDFSVILWGFAYLMLGQQWEKEEFGVAVTSVPVGLTGIWACSIEWTEQ